MNLSSNNEQSLKIIQSRLAFLWLGIIFVFLSVPVVTICQQPSTGMRFYRGSIGNNNIEMHLNIHASDATGTYSYDSIGEVLTISGRVDDQGRLQLTEVAIK